MAPCIAVLVHVNLGYCRRYRHRCCHRHLSSHEPHLQSHPLAHIEPIHRFICRFLPGFPEPHLLHRRQLPWPRPPLRCWWHPVEALDAHSNRQACLWSSRRYHRNLLPPIWIPAPLSGQHGASEGRLRHGKRSVHPTRPEGGLDPRCRCWHERHLHHCFQRP